MGVKRAVFVIGTLDFKAARKGEALDDRTVELLDAVATRCGVDAEVVFAIQDPWKAGKAKAKLGIEAIREERPRVLDEIGSASPDFVMCLGPVATASVFGKGNLVEGELLRRAHQPLGDAGPPVYVTFGLENIRYKTGLKKWLEMDVCAAVEGHSATEWGDYTVLLPGTDAWHRLPEDVAAVLEEQGGVGFDLETYPGLDPFAPDARIRMAVLGLGPKRALVVQATPSSELPEWVAEIAENRLFCKAGSNIKFDYVWMRRFGYRLENIWDTSTAEHILDESNPKKDLKSLTFKYASWLGDYSKEHRDMVRERGGWEYIDDDEQYKYAGGDGEASFCTWKAQEAEIARQGLQLPMALFRRLYEVLAEMEYSGACVDMDTLARLDKLHEEKLSALRQDIVEELGPINPNSPVQLADALRKAVPSIKLTKNEWKKVTGNDETDEVTTKRAVLEREAHKHPIIGIVLEFRKYRTRHSTFIVSVRDKYARVHAGKTFIHPRYRTDVVETYRLSSQAPNGQNIPRKDNDDPALTVKQQFVSRFEGGKIIEGDLSQIEIRFAAQLSKDRVMLEAIESGEDIHTAMACKFLDKDTVTDEERTASKTLTFLILYGGGPRLLAQGLGTSLNQAKALIASYFGTFRALSRYIDRCTMEVKQHLMVKTLFGFRRRFEEPEHWDSGEGKSIERKAFNTKVQNGAACITYCALIWLADRFEERGLRSKIILQVHDSIVIDAHPDEVDEVAALLHESLTTGAASVALEFDARVTVPLDCDIEVGDNWGNTKEWTRS